jgi:hypothetical protein
MIGLRFRLIAFALCTSVAGTAHSAELNRIPLSLVERTTEPTTAPSARFNFRLVADQAGLDRLTQAPLRRSGMIASTEVAPNTTLGFGLVRSAPKRTSDLRPGPRGAGSRKAAVSFQLKF